MVMRYSRFPSSTLLPCPLMKANWSKKGVPLLSLRGYPGTKYLNPSVLKQALERQEPRTLRSGRGFGIIPVCWDPGWGLGLRL